MNKFLSFFSCKTSSDSFKWESSQTEDLSKPQPSLIVLNHESLPKDHDAEFSKAESLLFRSNISQKPSSVSLQA
jgi:hypothetical protein